LFIPQALRATEKQLRSSCLLDVVKRAEEDEGALRRCRERGVAPQDKLIKKAKESMTELENHPAYPQWKPARDACVRAKTAVHAARSAAAKASNAAGAKAKA
jgi:hypothetical protein